MFGLILLAGVGWLLYLTFTEPKPPHPPCCLHADNKTECRTFHKHLPKRPGPHKRLRPWVKEILHREG